MSTTRPIPGDILAGKYRVERLIGEGGMGFVLSAMHVELDRRVAIKLLRQEFSHRSDAAERLRREARSAAKIRSEHVARVLDVGTIGNGETFIVMEHLDGNDLADEMRLRGRLPVSEAVAFLSDIARGVAEAHACGIVHRDLKPANVFLVTHADGSRSAKVLDFGISKSLFLSTAGDIALTRSSAVMGSPIYMSPEQMQSAKDVDHRTDIWALGAILYEMLAGDPPHRGPSMADVCSAVLNDPPESLSRFRSDIPPGLEPLVLKCLSKERDERFRSVTELVTALEVLVPPRPRHSLRFSRAGSRPGVKSLPFLVIAEDRPSAITSAVTSVSASPTDAPQSLTMPPPLERAEGGRPKMPFVFLLGAAALTLGVVIAFVAFDGAPAAPLPVTGSPVPAAAPPALPGVALPGVAPAGTSTPGATAPPDPTPEIATETVAAESKTEARSSTSSSKKSKDRTRPPRDGTREAMTARQALGADGIPEFGGRR